jgi:hypothetical protein
MKLFSIIIILFASNFCVASELVRLNAQWLNKNEVSISERLQNSSNVDAMPLINTLG